MLAPPIVLCCGNPCHITATPSSHPPFLIQCPLSCCLLSTPYLPCKQLLAVVVGGAVVVIGPGCNLSAPPFVIGDRVVTWPLAPNLPCEQMLTAAVLGAGLSPPHSHSSPIHTSLPPYEQLLIAEGSGAVGLIISPSPLSLLSSCPMLVVLVLLLLVLVLLVLVLCVIVSVI